MTLQMAAGDDFVIKWSVPRAAQDDPAGAPTAVQRSMMRVISSLHVYVWPMVITCT